MHRMHVLGVYEGVVGRVVNAQAMCVWVCGCIHVRVCMCKSWLRLELGYVAPGGGARDVEGCGGSAGGIANMTRGS